MSIDPHEAIIQKFYNTITGDSDMQDLVGGTFHIYNDKAGKDPDLPYFVHEVSTEKIDTGRRRGTYVLDWYENSKKSSGVWDIRRRLFILLDEARLETTEAGLIRVNNQMCDPVPESEPGIQHYHSRWNIRYFASEIVGEINSR